MGACYSTKVVSQVDEKGSSAKKQRLRGAGSAEAEPPAALGTSDEIVLLKERNSKAVLEANLADKDGAFCENVPEVVLGTAVGHEVLLPPGAVPSSPLCAAGVPPGAGVGVVLAAPSAAGRSLAAVADFAAEPSAPLRPLRLQPVSSTLAQMEALFPRYLERVPKEIAQSLDCSWGQLAKAAEAVASPADDLQWFWLSAPGEEEPTASSALGLVVVRLVRGGSANHAQVVHFSLASASWRDDAASALQALKHQFFLDLPVQTIRVTLWYSVVVDGSRGQIVACRRNMEAGDPPAPEELLDLRFGCCLFLPYVPEAGAVAEAAMAPTASMAASNSLVMAECLRRHALEQRDAGAEGAEGAGGAGGGASPAPAAASVVGELYRKLRRRGTLGMVQSAEAEEAKQCSDFAARCLEGLGGSAALPSTALPRLEAASPSAAGVARRVLCGGLHLGLNWQSTKASPDDDARWVHVPVQAASESGDVVYLATEDDDIFLSVWRLQDSSNGSTPEALYRHCQAVLREQPPAKVGDERPFAVVALPTCSQRSAGSALVPSVGDRTQAFEAPSEVLALRLAARPAPRGALRREPPREELATRRLEGPLVVCAWHARLEDLEVPLFVAVVGGEPATEAECG